MIDRWTRNQTPTQTKRQTLVYTGERATVHLGEAGIEKKKKKPVGR